MTAPHMGKDGVTVLHVGKDGVTVLHVIREIKQCY